MTYTIQIQEYERSNRTLPVGVWRQIIGDKKFAGFTCKETFNSLDCCVSCAKGFIGWAKLNRTNYSWNLRIIGHDGCLCWFGTTSSDNTQTTGGETNMATPDLNKPLTIARTDLVDKLQENLDAEVAKREAKEAEQAAERETVLAAIAEFTPDELYNIFRSFYTVDDKNLALDKTNQAFVTPTIKPTRIETDTEKFVRVLTMANDTNIELTPGESLYALL